MENMRASIWVDVRGYSEELGYWTNRQRQALNMQRFDKSYRMFTT